MHTASQMQWYMVLLTVRVQFHFRSDLPLKIPPDWYANKDKPWYLSSINPFLSKIAATDYAITPNTTNLAESAHAGTNAQTSTKLALLPAILRCVYELALPGALHSHCTENMPATTSKPTNSAR